MSFIRGSSSLTVLGRMPIEVPQLLDVLIVGAGPAGTAAAFRARELGLAALVIDYDDVLKRIRDYSKDKLILPNFGGGDRMAFPKAGTLLDQLRFAPIDKDALHQGWKRLYLRHGIPIQVGIELLGIERLSPEIWQVDAWDHGQRAERTFAARALVLAIGRGVPRRFDIPGNTEGIAFRLSDPQHYVGRPACVIGGGTSAAEAVIAISNAKIAADDPTRVYWSYRGDRLPRVSKALAEVFFEAYLGNGNIAYHPLSEPVAVVAGDDKIEYLAVRIDRKHVEGRPAETTLLEFPKDCCVACIGEDVPEKLLATLGIPMVAREPGGTKRMLASPLHETAQTNVFLAGDLLSQAYFETDDFAAEPARWREVAHRGNVKSALRDGVFAIEAIAQKLAGRLQIRVELADAEDLPIPEGVGGGLVVAVEAAAKAAAKVVEAARPAARLVRLLVGDVAAEEHPLLAEGTLAIGRAGCEIVFPDDDSLADRHASVRCGPEGWWLRDEGGATGVFLRARPGATVRLRAGDLVRAGRQFLLVAGEGEPAEVRHFDHLGKEVGRHRLATGAAIYGREAPDVTLDPGDRGLSRRHLSLHRHEGAVVLKDLNSANGTYLRVRGEALLTEGEEIIVGRQRLRFTAVAAERVEKMVSAPARAPIAAAPAARPAAATVTFRDLGKSLPITPSQTVCEVAEAAGIEINAECHAGLCGSDPVRIVAGQEHANPVSGDEAETLKQVCRLDPGPCRLACMLKVKGPVTVERVRAGR